jgi:hypothetical protein
MASSLKGDRISLPSATSNPSSPGVGDQYFNTNNNSLSIYDGTVWGQVNFAPLGSVNNPASSAADILTADSTATSGFYYITTDGVDSNVYCDMTNDNGGWMLAAHANGTDNNKWTYNDSSWTNSTTFNETDNPTSTSNHIKTKIYTTRPFTSVRICMGSISNGIVESNWSNSTSFANFMGSSSNSSNSSTTWKNWVNTAFGSSHAWLVNCNQFGTSKAYNYQWVRLGGTINGENDCNTNDESFGWGSLGISPYTNNYSCGAYSPYGGPNGLRDGWIFVK